MILAQKMPYILREDSRSRIITIILSDCFPGSGALKKEVGGKSSYVGNGLHVPAKGCSFLEIVFVQNWDEYPKPQHFHGIERLL